MIGPLLALSLLAAPDISAAYGNTIVTTHKDGRSSRLWIRKDGTYTIKGRRGGLTSGTWKIKGGKVCFSQTKPTKGPFALCKVVPTVKIGQKWNDKTIGGQAVVNELVAGVR